MSRLLIITRERNQTGKRICGQILEKLAVTWSCKKEVSSMRIKLSGIGQSGR